MKKLLPVLLAVVGLGAGAGAGLFLKPEPEPEVMHAADDTDPCPPQEHMADASHDADGHETGGSSAFVKFDNQFVIPVTSSDAIVSLVVLSLTLEVAESGRDSAFQKLPKIRDAFLSVLFDHSASGGFSSDFVNGRGLETLREMLTETGVAVAGSDVLDVLIVDLIKQDV